MASGHIAVVWRLTLVLSCSSIALPPLAGAGPLAIISGLKKRILSPAWLSGFDTKAAYFSLIRREAFYDQTRVLRSDGASSIGHFPEFAVKNPLPDGSEFSAWFQNGPDGDDSTQRPADSGESGRMQEHLVDRPI